MRPRRVSVAVMTTPRSSRTGSARCANRAPTFAEVQSTTSDTANNTSGKFTRLILSPPDRVLAAPWAEDGGGLPNRPLDLGLPGVRAHPVPRSSTSRWKDRAGVTVLGDTRWGVSSCRHRRRQGVLGTL